METKFVDVENESSSLSFSIQEDGGKPWWNCVDHNRKPLYIVSNRCGTCPAVFRLVKEKTDPLLAERINSFLNAGFNTIPNSVIETISHLVPKGKYFVSLQKITPRYSRINSGDVDYNWISKLDVPHNDGYVSESIYPIIPEHVLDYSRIKHYYYLPYTSPELNQLLLRCHSLWIVFRVAKDIMYTLVIYY
jgi:hypothetical protein